MIRYAENSANVSLLIFQFVLWPWHLLPSIRRPFSAALYEFVHSTNKKKKTGRGTGGFRETGLLVGQVALGWISCQPTVADSMSSSCEPASPIKPYQCIYPSSTSSPIPGSGNSWEIIEGSARENRAWKERG